MPRVPNSGRKSRTREHVIADLALNHVERQVLLSGNTVERWVHDYGLDLVLFTYTEAGEPESGMVFLQVKATDHLRSVSDGKYITCRIERAHLRAWLAEAMPILLIIYDALRDRSYWLYIQAAFAGAQRFRAARGSEQLTVRIPVKQLLDPAAVGLFRSYRQVIVEKIEGVRHEEQ